MKLAIISTTIHGEKGYLPYDRLAMQSKFSEVRFFIAADLKSPPFNTKMFQCSIEYIDVDTQKKFYCSEPMGWNKIMRRNIALLCAIGSKPDYILTIDDDNIPSDDYFDKWYEIITQPVKRIVTPVNGGYDESYWHNYLETSDADIEIYPRGFPIPFRDRHHTEIKITDEPIPPEKIGFYQGISLGDPDIDAATRIVYSKPLPLNKIGQKNYCLRNIWSPYNTQNTLFCKKLFPLVFTWPHCGRFDDIYASFVWQRFLFNNDMHVHIGEAVNRQDRGVRNPLIDLRNEVEGYFHSHEVWKLINEIKEIDPLSFIRKLTECDNEIITRHNEFFLAYLKDIEKVL